MLTIAFLQQECIDIGNFKNLGVPVHAAFLSAIEWLGQPSE
jgi:hypothetical protein